MPRTRHGKKNKSYSAKGNVEVTTTKPRPKSTSANVNPAPPYAPSAPSTHRISQKKKDPSWEEHLNKVLAADVKAKPSKTDSKNAAPKYRPRVGTYGQNMPEKEKPKKAEKPRSLFEIANDTNAIKKQIADTGKSTPFTPQDMYQSPVYSKKDIDKIKKVPKEWEEAGLSDEYKKLVEKDIKKIKKYNKQTRKENLAKFSPEYQFSPEHRKAVKEEHKLADYRARLMAAKKDLKNEHEVAKMREEIKGESAKDRQEREKRIRADELAQYTNALTKGGSKHKTKKQTKKDLAKQAIYEYKKNKGFTGFGDAMGFQTKDQTIKSRTGYDISKEVAKAKESLKYQGGYMGGIGVSFIGPGMAEGAVATGIKGGVRGAKALATGKKIVGTGDNAIRLAKGAKGVKNATGTIPKQFNRPLLNKIAQGKAPKLTERAGTKIAGELARGGNERLAKQVLKNRLGENAKDFAARRAADVVVSTPLNINEAQKFGRDENGKLTASGFAKSFAFNTAMDMAFGTLFQGIGSKVGKMNAKKAIVEVIDNGGENLSEKTLTQLKKLNMEPDDVLVKAKNVEELAQKYAKEAPVKTPKAQYTRNVVHDLRHGKKYDKAFSEQVDRYLKGEMKSHEILNAGKTPAILQKHGAPNLHLTMEQSAVMKIAYPAGYNKFLRKSEAEALGKKLNEKTIKDIQGHNLGIGAIKSLRKDLERPAAILVEPDDTFCVFIKKVDEHGDPIMVPIHLNKRGRIEPANNIASAFGVKDYKGFIERNKNNIVFEDKKMGLDDLPDSGGRITEWGDPSDPINKMLPEKTADVKGVDKNIPPSDGTKTPQSTTPVKPKGKLETDGTSAKKPETVRSPEEIKKATAGKVTTKVEKKNAVELLHSGETKKFFHAIKRNMVDDFEAWERFFKKTGNKEGSSRINTLRASNKISAYHIAEEQVDIRGNKVGQSLNSIWEPIKKRGKDYYEAVQDYSFHLHNIDRVKQGKPVFEGVSAAESRTMVKELEKTFTGIKDDVAKIHKYLDNEQQLRIDTGLISKSQYDVMKDTYPNYVPTYRVAPNPRGMKEGYGSIRIENIKKAKGSDLAIEPLDVQMKNNTKQVVEAANMNRLVRLVADDLGVDVPKGKKFSVDEIEDILKTVPNENGNFSVKGYKNGKEFTVELPKEMFHGLKSLKPKKSEYAIVNGVLKIHGGGVRLFKNLITSYNLYFVAKNGMRDMQDAVLYTKNLKGFCEQIVTGNAHWEMKNNGKYWKLYKSMGGLSSSLFDSCEGMIKENKAIKVGRAVKKQTLDRIEHLNQQVEQFPRFCEFLSTLEKGGFESMTDKVAQRKLLEKAVLNSADVTINFGRGGRFGKIINQYGIPFFNPAMQEMDKIARTLKGGDNGKIVKASLKLLTRASIFGVGWGVLQEAILGDDEYYKNLPDREKDLNYFIKLNDGKFIKLPKGRFMSVLTNIPQRIIGGRLGTKDEWATLIDTTVQQIGPNTWQDNIFKPILNSALRDKNDPGKTFYGADLETWDERENKQAGDRWDERTSWFAKEIGKRTNLSPKKIDNILKSYTGIVGDIVLTSSYMATQTDLIKNIKDKNANAAVADFVKIIGSPMVRKFSLDAVYSNDIQSNFYKKQDEINERAKGGKDKQAVAQKAYFTQLGYQISALRDAKKMNAFNTELSPEKRAQKDRELKKAIDDYCSTGSKGDKAFAAFCKKHKNDYPTKKALYEAAMLEAEKNSTSNQTLYTIAKEIGTIPALMMESKYTDIYGDPRSNNIAGKKTPLDIYKESTKNGVKKDKAFNDILYLQKIKKENGVSLDPKHNTLVAALALKGKIDKQTAKAMGVTKKDKEIVNKFLKDNKKSGMKDIISACAAIDETANKSEGAKKGKHYTTNYKAAALSRMGAPIGLYEAVDSHKKNLWGGDKKSGTLKMANTGKGVVKEGFSDKYLGALDDRIKTDRNGFNTEKSIKANIDKEAKKKGYNNKKMALLYDFFSSGYGDNPYGMVANYLDPKDKKVVTASTDSGGGKGKGGGHGGGRGRGGGSGGSGNTKDWYTFLDEIGIDRKTMKPKSTVDWKTKKAAATKFKKFNPKASAQQKALVKMLVNSTRK